MRKYTFCMAFSVSGERSPFWLMGERKIMFHVKPLA